MKKLFFTTILISISFSSSLQSKTTFTSRYLDTSADCACLEKNLQEGQDCTRFSCKEMDGYHTQISFDGSACDLGKLKVIKDSKELVSLNEVPSKIEWRFAGDEPIAVIYRIKGPSKNCADQLGSPIKKEMLIVFGLGKYSSTSGQVDGKAANSNAKARDLADQGFSGKAGNH
jgi:hypothetical protein